MANWKGKISLADVWESEDVQSIANALHKRLKALPPVYPDDVEEERQRLVDELEMVKDDCDFTVEDFDDLLNQVYDWGDTPLDDRWPATKVCWIETF